MSGTRPAPLAAARTAPAEGLEGAVESRAPQCRRCGHYYITHDPSFPYGCRALDFKSRQAPIREVKDASGQDCLYFKPRLTPGQA